MLTIPHPGQSNHNGGKLAFGHDGYLYAGTGDGGGGNDNAGRQQRAESVAAGSASCCGSTSTRTSTWRRTTAFRRPIRSPPNACDGVEHRHLSRDLGVRAAQSVALDVRPPDRRPLHRRRRAERARGSRLRPVARNAGPQLRLADHGRQPLHAGRESAAARRRPTTSPPIIDYPHPPGVAVIGGYRYRGDAVPALAGAYLYADEGSNLHLGGDARRHRACGPRSSNCMGTPTAISAFGEDEAGELYAVGLGNGTIYKIARIDSDADGLPDWWELAYFGSTTAAAPGADADADGATNLQEYLGGHRPAVRGEQARRRRSSKASLAVWRPSTARFFIDVDFDLTADQKVYFGATTDTPLVGRIDPGRELRPRRLPQRRCGTPTANRDGIARLHARRSAASPGDVPLLADFNGDGRDDLVIYRGGSWYVSTAQNGVAAMTFGFGGVAGRHPARGRRQRRRHRRPRHLPERRLVHRHQPRRRRRHRGASSAARPATSRCCSTSTATARPTSASSATASGT